MTPESQRIAIAEACGWESEPDKYYADRLAWREPISKQRFSTVDLPDYLNDLNAMHEAEKVLTPEQGWEYAQNLAVEGGKGWFATAAQRAEAFLRTLGLWDNSGG